MKPSSPFVCALLCALLPVLAACGGTTAPAPPPAVSSASAPAVASAAPTAAPVADGPPRLLLISAINGYVEPCGCTVDLTLGGIDRIATRIAEERRAGPTAVLMVGSVLFDPHVDDAHLADQEAAKAEVLARALSRIGVDATVTTHTELKYGPGVLDPLRKTWPLPEVTVNVPGGAPKLLTLGGLKVGVFGVVDAAPGPTPSGTPGDPEVAARAAAQKLRADGAQVVVGLAALPRKALRTLAKGVEGVDLWALGDTPNEEVRSQPVGKAYVLEAGDRGRNLGRVLLLDAATDGPLADPAGDRAREQKSLELQLKMREDVFQRTRETTLTAVIAEMKARMDVLAQSPPPRRGQALRVRSSARAQGHRARAGDRRLAGRLQREVEGNQPGGLGPGAPRARGRLGLRRRQGLHRLPRGGAAGLADDPAQQGVEDPRRRQQDLRRRVRLLPRDGLADARRREPEEPGGPHGHSVRVVPRARPTARGRGWRRRDHATDGARVRMYGLP